MEKKVFHTQMLFIHSLRKYHLNVDLSTPVTFGKNIGPYFHIIDDKQWNECFVLLFWLQTKKENNNNDKKKKKPQVFSTCVCVLIHKKSITL